MKDTLSSSVLKLTEGARKRSTQSLICNAAYLRNLERVLYGTTAGDVYDPTEDTTVDSEKTYYKLENGSYTAVTPEQGDNPKTNGWYEKVTLTDTDARLPLPDEVISILKGTPSNSVGG